MQLTWIGRNARVSAGAGRTIDWSKQELLGHACAIAGLLARHPASARVGLLSDNGPEWIALDLAAHVAGTTLVPLPGFFTHAQLDHVVRDAGLDALWCSDGKTATNLGFDRRIGSFLGLTLYERRTVASVTGEERTSIHRKVTFTSGSTGTPKGVCLSDEQQLKPARSLADLLTPLGIRRHLNLLPLSILLENVAGVYVPLMLDATCISPSLSRVGMSGATGFDADRCLDAIADNAPDSVILLPQMLKAILGRLDGTAGRDSRIRSLKFVAVGGAKTSPQVISRARQLGLPVFEGYGLTECASVVSVNVPFADRIGSVGRALPGTDVRVAADGEVQVAGRSDERDPGTTASWIPTGDIGSIDANGYLFVSGRKDSLIITSFGRNVSPEWPESLLLAHPDIEGAAVFGEGRPFLAAVLNTRTASVSDASIDSAVRAVNRQLPDYARIGAWYRAPDRFTAQNGMVTANGRVRRSAIWARYAGELNALFEQESARQ